MQRVTIKHACGHKQQHAIKGGTARSRSAEMFELSLHFCTPCEAEADDAYWQGLDDNRPCVCEGRGCGQCQYTGIA